MSFQQVKDKYGIGSGDVFRYMQVKHFILGRLKECDGRMSLSQMESLILKTTKLKSFSKSVYNILSKLNKDNADKVKKRWETDLGPITAESWDELCNRPFKALVSNSIWERQFKILHRLFITPEKRHKMYSSLSEICNKCHSAVGTLFHCLWDCPPILQFWESILDKLCTIFKCHLNLSARTCLLGLEDELPRRFVKRKLLHILLHCARKCLMVQWISDEAPSHHQWLQTVIAIIPMEAFSTLLMNKPYAFYKTWDPFLNYLDFSSAQRLRSGLLSMAWPKER